jgi:hypothetical protein
MKKVFVLAMALCMTLGLSAQKREGNVVTVQGHVHEWLTKQAAGKEPAKVQPRTPVGSVYNVNPAQVNCWVGCVNTTDPTMQPVDTAYLLVKWTDGKAAKRADKDSIMIWGYIWNSKTPVYSYDVNKYSIDMIRAVANFDPHFTALLQNTGGGDFAVGGFGYNCGANARVPIEYDYTGAKRESDTDTIHFRYDTAPNCAAPYNQFALPDTTQRAIAMQAITDAFRRTGVIKHPFDAMYSYPAYDYDYWKVGTDRFNNYQWQAGWTYGYWSFNIREGLSGTFTYAPNGVATQQLQNNSVHYFVFAPITVYDPFLDGNYSARGCSSPYCADCNTTTTK